MSFLDIKPVDKYESYIDKAFGRASKRAGQMKVAKKWTRLDKIKNKELVRLQVVVDNLASDLNELDKRFPSIKDLNEFYKKLVEIMIGIVDFKKSFARINWAGKKIHEFHRTYRKKIRISKDINRITRFRKEFYGRINSVMKQIKPALEFLEFARKEFRKFPVIKEIFSIAIAGFPNVGKSTLLYKLTGSKPEIAAYPFTTKGIMLGYLKHDDKKIQLLDTPGTLNRFEKMNIIEKQAWLALKHVADVVIYIFDLTEPFPLTKQIKLYEKIKKLDKPVIAYLSKTDIIKKDIKDFQEKYKAFADANELKKKIITYSL